jgi:hypothetical protein
MTEGKDECLVGDFVDQVRRGRGESEHRPKMGEVKFHESAEGPGRGQQNA